MRRFLLILFSVTLAGLLYVYTEVEAMKLGYTIRKGEESKTQLMDRGRALRFQVSNLKSSANLEKRLSERRVVLESPKELKTLVLNAYAQPKPQENIMQTFLKQPFFNKFFIGTAQAEARES